MKRQGCETKKVVLETGYVLTVPAFVQVGDVVKVDTRSRQYVGRVRGISTYGDHTPNDD